jgi:ATP-dependent DNA ligase
MRSTGGTDAMPYAFDLLELNGKDLRLLPLGDRKAKLARLLARAPAGIVFNEHTDEDGAENRRVGSHRVPSVPAFDASNFAR